MYKGFWMIRLHLIGRSAVHQKDIHRLDVNVHVFGRWEGTDTGNEVIDPITEMLRLKLESIQQYSPITLLVGSQ